MCPKPTTVLSLLYYSKICCPCLGQKGSFGLLVTSSPKDTGPHSVHLSAAERVCLGVVLERKKRVRGSLPCSQLRPHQGMCLKILFSLYVSVFSDSAYPHTPLLSVCLSPSLTSPPFILHIISWDFNYRASAESGLWLILLAPHLGSGCPVGYWG
jgi:hypothetical protein